MSTINIVKFSGEAASLEAAIRTYTRDFEALAEDARSVGCIHHRFVASSSEIVLIDEWRDIEAAATKFWFNPKTMTLMRQAGVKPTMDARNYHPIEDVTAF